MKTDQKKLGELVLWLIILIVCLVVAIYVMITGNRQRSQKNTADQGTMENAIEAAEDMRTSISVVSEGENSEDQVTETSSEVVDPDDAVSGVVEIINDE